MHVGLLAVLDGRSLLDGDGRVRLAEIRERIAHSASTVPALRRVMYRAGPLTGRPLWVDDAAFEIDWHVQPATVDPPGGPEQLLRLVTRLMGPLLDRSRPLWRLWVVGGLPDGRIAVVVKLHHAVADGLAAVRLVSALLDPSPEPDGEWIPAPPPRWAELVVENAATRLGALRRAARRMTDPAGFRRATKQMLATVRSLARTAGTPRTSLNSPVGPRRRLAVIRLDLASVRATAHGSGGKVNDVILALIAGGLRELLRTRGEAVDRVVLRAGVAVSVRTAVQADQAGNRSGIIVVRLPSNNPVPAGRLAAVVAETAAAKRDQSVATEQCLMVWLAKSGLMRYFSRRQHMTNLIESNVPGPADVIRVLGVPVLDLIPIGVLAGNLTVAFLAFSYAGLLTVTVYADADRHPDLPVLVDAMARDATALGIGGVEWTCAGR